MEEEGGERDESPRRRLRSQTRAHLITELFNATDIDTIHSILLLGTIDINTSDEYGDTVLTKNIEKEFKYYTLYNSKMYNTNKTITL